MEGLSKRQFTWEKKIEIHVFSNILGKLLFKTVSQEKSSQLVLCESEELNKSKSKVAFFWFCFVHSICNSNTLQIAL